MQAASSQLLCMSMATTESPGQGHCVRTRFRALLGPFSPCCWQSISVLTWGLAAAGEGMRALASQHGPAPPLDSSASSGCQAVTEKLKAAGVSGRGYLWLG